MIFFKLFALILIILLFIDITRPVKEHFQGKIYSNPEKAGSIDIKDNSRERLLTENDFLLFEKKLIDFHINSQYSYPEKAGSIRSTKDIDYDSFYKPIKQSRKPLNFKMKKSKVSDSKHYPYETILTNKTKISNQESLM